MFNRGDSSVQKTAAQQECKKVGYLDEFRENLSYGGDEYAGKRMGYGHCL